MTDVIDVAAVEDNRMFADGLRAWAGTQPDIRLATVAATVAELLRTAAGRRFIVLLNSTLRTGADPADCVRRLVEAGHRVVVIDGSVDLTMVARTLSAGAHGYLTHNHDMAALAATVRAIALGGTVTGEHGVGILKRDGMRRELDPGSLALQTAIREALDPLAVFNPGKG